MQAAMIGTTKLAGLLRGPGGLQASIAAAAEAAGLTPITLSEGQIATRNIPAELMERTAGCQYPRVHVYCEKAANALREKSRAFSGTAQMAIEIRTSSDRVDGMEPMASVLIDAVTEVLRQNRGDLGDGVFYGGAYEISYGAVKHGGKNFLQSAKISLQLEVSRS